MPNTPTDAALERACDIIKQFEGCKLTAYLCPAGVPTIGWGSTGPDIKLGMTWTQEQADERLERDVKRFYDGVVQLVTAKATPNQTAACTSLSYNIGLGNFRASTVLRKLNEGDIAAAADAFRMWNKGGGKVLPGLVARREAERTLFLTP